jgi:3-isopropylmalate/(R)-2-methylmalate dehydratase small subunit
LNQPAWANARFLVVGDNFGCGSSREHAVWGLGQLGIRALIGTSFAGIFFDNCARNGLLAIVVSQTASDHLMQLAAQEETNGLTIDLPQQTITAADGSAVSFEIDALRKVAMLRGLDSIDLTLQDREMIEDFEKIHFLGSPWLQGGAARARRS